MNAWLSWSVSQIIGRYAGATEPLPENVQIGPDRSVFADRICVPSRNFVLKDGTLPQPEGPISGLHIALIAATMHQDAARDAALQRVFPARGTNFGNLLL
jgi:hypothetical protein